MSRLVARILLSILMFPLAGLFYIVCMVIIESMQRMSTNYNRRETEMFFVAGGLTWILVAIYWSLLWKSSVRWTSHRVGGTFVAAGVAMTIGAAAGFIAAGVMNDSGSASFGVFVGSVLSIILWLIATILLWQESPAERAARIKSSGKSSVACPTCGYNLTGLTESRCPECGSKFTLDELIAAQAHEVGDVE